MRVSHQRLVGFFFFCEGGPIWTLWTRQEGRTYAVDTHTDEDHPHSTTECVYTRKHFCVPNPGKCLPSFESARYKLSFRPSAARLTCAGLVLGLPSRCVKSFNCLHELRPAGGNPSSESGALSPRKLSSSEKTCERKAVFCAFTDIFAPRYSALKLNFPASPSLARKRLSGNELKLRRICFCRPLVVNWSAGQTLILAR